MPPPSGGRQLRHAKRARRERLPRRGARVVFVDVALARRRGVVARVARAARGALVRVGGAEGVGAAGQARRQVRHRVRGEDGRAAERQRPGRGGGGHAQPLVRPARHAEVRRQAQTGVGGARPLHGVGHAVVRAGRRAAAAALALLLFLGRQRPPLRPLVEDDLVRERVRDLRAPQVLPRAPARRRSRCSPRSARARATACRCATAGSTWRQSATRGSGAVAPGGSVYTTCAPKRAAHCSSAAASPWPGVGAPAGPGRKHSCTSGGRGAADGAAWALWARSAAWAAGR